MLRPPDQWVELGPWGLVELAVALILCGVTIAILVFQPLILEIAVGLILGELGLMGLKHIFGRYQEFRPGLKTAVALRVQKQDQS